MHHVIFTALITAVSSVALTATAFAHAHLQTAQPPIGGTIKTPPAELDLTFSEELNLKFTGMKVVGPDNKEVKTDNAMLMGGDKIFMVTLPETLSAGTYQVEWHALSRDGHKTHGEYKFTIKP